ncbi:MAG: HPr kinase/phosphorylase [Gammaproteobacteria bacterium]|jgi:hypothetical protein|nr:HPr kinase/phosphorylase [Gammaproteobacteria bacterium]
MFHYYAYGLNFASDIEIPELLWSTSPSESAIEIYQGKIDEFTNDNIQNYIVYGKPQKLFLNIPQVAKFLVEDGQRIIYHLYEGAHIDEFRLFLLGSCFGAILQQRGYIVLHGNAVSVEGKTCKIFVGDQGAGKSTTAAWFMKQGARILADDVCAITFNEALEPMVIPGFPQLKIWQDTADKLAINTQVLRRVRPQDAKYALPFKERFCTDPLPITAIIELKKDNGISQQVVGLEKLKKLILHSYRYCFLTHQQLETTYNKQLLQLAQNIHLSSISRQMLVSL